MKSVVLFDGVCSLCGASVQFIIRHDPAARLRFASLQSKVGRELLERHGLESANSVVLISDGRAFTESDAALRIARELDFPWRLAWNLRFAPVRLRNAVYRLIAANRYRLFGRKAVCELPSPKLRGRFLDG